MKKTVVILLLSLITTVMFSQKNAKIEYYEFEREMNK